MKKIYISILALLLVIGFSFHASHAQVTSTEEEAIGDFHSAVTVNTDNSVDVVETILYNSGPYTKHGIYRDIYPFSSQGRPMKIEVNNVTDLYGNPYHFETTNSGQNFRIKIGDADRTFTGAKDYIIRYHATQAVGQLEKVDEIYWNVTGNEWPMPIHHASAFVHLPTLSNSREAVPLQSACYYGPRGSTATCGGQATSSPNVTTLSFETPSPLGINQGLTVAVGFDKGIVTVYTPPNKILEFLKKYLIWIISALIPIFTLIYCLIYWYKNGRDPKGTGVIVPQYDVPEGLTPMEVEGIVDQGISAESISAEIIYLATKGYIKIREVESGIFGFKTKDYELTRLEGKADLPNLFDRNLLRDIFGINNTVKISDLKNTFYRHADAALEAAWDAISEKGYYRNPAGKNKNASKIWSMAIIAVFGFIFLSGGIRTVTLALTGNNGTVPIITGSIIALFIYFFMSAIFPAKTEKGIQLKEYILGLKDYLMIAEKDRLIFHNAPEKKPEIFEALLPFAMVLGVANIWAKEFEGIYTTPPDWYSSSSGANFNSLIFAHSISNFTTASASSMTSTPGGNGVGGGGSGGGGFSGGGGGGGGGGSW